MQNKIWFKTIINHWLFVLTKSTLVKLNAWTSKRFLAISFHYWLIICFNIGRSTHGPKFWPQRSSLPTMIITKSNAFQKIADSWITACNLQVEADLNFQPLSDLWLDQTEVLVIGVIEFYGKTFTRWLSKKFWLKF